MILLADESIERALVDGLRREGYLVHSVSESHPGASDREVFGLSKQTGAVLLTEDKDFGELVFGQGLASSGVILLRLEGLATPRKVTVASAAVVRYEREFPGCFAVVTPGLIRVRRLQQQ